MSHEMDRLARNIADELQRMVGELRVTANRVHGAGSDDIDIESICLSFATRCEALAAPLYEQLKRQETIGEIIKGINGPK